MGAERPILTFINRILKDKRTRAVAKSIGQGLRLQRLCSNCTTNNGQKTTTDHDQHEDADGNKYYFCSTCGSHN
jgi:hypothetical protein